jgi:hypothetical protein
MQDPSPFPDERLEKLRCNYAEDLEALHLAHVAACAECVANWFFENYEDPVHHTSRDSGEWAVELEDVHSLLFDEWDADDWGSDALSAEVFQAALDKIEMFECAPSVGHWEDDEEPVSLEMG